MKNSLSLGKVAGIKLYLHWTFILLPAWIIFVNVRAGHSALETIWAIGFILSIFVCVVLHEMGHALAARKYGIATRDITLLPIGGMARLESMPEKPKEELVVAIAGPLVNVGIALIVMPLVAVTTDVLAVAELETISEKNFLLSFFVVNVWLVLFNLIPAFPMDGGRMLRALLSFRMERHRATKVASRIGQVFAVGFMLFGLFSNPFLIFIGFFIFLSAKAESDYTTAQSFLKGYSVKDVLMKDYHSVDSDETLKTAVDAMLNSQGKNFLVLKDGLPVGTLNRDEIIKGLSGPGESALISQVMNTQQVRLRPDMSLEDAWLVLRQHKSLLPVMSDYTLEGTLDEENILEFIMVNQAKGRE